MKKIIAIIIAVFAAITINAQTLSVNKASARAIAEQFQNGYFTLVFEEGKFVSFSIDWNDESSYTADEDLNIESGYFTAKIKDEDYITKKEGTRFIIDEFKEDETKTALTLYYAYGLVVDKVEIGDDYIKGYFYSTEI